MRLQDCRMNASIAVSDMDRATAFYEGELGLRPETTGADGSKVYATAGGASLHVYPSPEHAGRSTATLATWYVDDVGQMVDALTASGVTFEHYDMPGVTRQGDIHLTGKSKAAWFKDPDGNIIALVGR